MKRSGKLSFEGEHKKNSKRIKSFVLAFCAFVLVLGSVSAVMFMKHLNFDIKNIVPSAETTAAGPADTTAAPVNLEGEISVLFFCENSEHKISFAYCVLVDYPKKTVSLCAVPLTDTVTAESFTGTLDGHFEKFGVTGVRDAVCANYDVKADRYIKCNEAQFKKFLSKFEDITVDVKSEIDDRESGLILNSGEQTLSPEMYVKYIRYCDYTDATEAFGKLLETILDAKYSSKTEDLFSFIANNSETDITIVDFKNEQEKIAALSAAEHTVSCNGVLTAKE